MEALKLLSRSEMKMIKGGSGLGGCYIECCTVIPGGQDHCTGAGTSVPTSEEGGGFENCSSHSQCQSDYIANQGLDPCAGSGGYASALCYS